MHQLRRARHRLGPRGRGAAAVETALVLPVILLIFFGILEFGMLFKDWFATISATRAGARLASAEPRNATFAQDAADQVQNAATALNLANVQALWVYKADANGYPVGGGGAAFTGCTVCVKYTWDAGANAFTQVSNTWASTAQNACAGDPLHDTIGIYLQLKHDSFTRMVFNNFVLKEHAVLALEPLPATTFGGCR